MSNVMLALCTNTLSITNNTITNNAIRIYIYKWMLLVIAYQHLKPGTQIFGHLIGEFDSFILIWQIQNKNKIRPTYPFSSEKNYGKQDIFFMVPKHNNSTNFNHIGPKLIPWMYLRSVLVKFEYGWPWPIFRGHGVGFQHENVQFLLVDTITQHILVALGLSLYHVCFSLVSCLSSKMDDLDLFFEVMGVDKKFHL